MLKLTIQYFGHLIQRADSLEKTLMLAKTEGRRRRGWQRMRWLDGHNGHESEQTLGDSEGQGSLVCVLQSIGSQKVRQDSATGQLRHTKYLAFSLDSQ